MRDAHSRSTADLGYEIVGYVDDNPTREGKIGRFCGFGRSTISPRSSTPRTWMATTTLPRNYHRRILG